MAKKEKVNKTLWRTFHKSIYTPLNYIIIIKLMFYFRIKV